MAEIECVYFRTLGSESVKSCMRIEEQKKIIEKNELKRGEYEFIIAERQN